MNETGSVSTAIATTGVCGHEAMNLGGEAVRLAQLATALHLSQAAPLLAGAGAPSVWIKSQESAT